MINYSIESFEECIPEIKGLAQLHYDEIDERSGVFELDPDWSQYVSLEKADVLFLSTVRVDNKMVGYFIALVMPHLHNKNVITAFTDVLFLHKKHRKSGIGRNFLKFIIEAIKTMGAKLFYIACKITHDLGPLFESMGFTEIERNYMMVFDNE